MIATLPLHEAARTFLAVVAEVRATNHEAVITENGEPVAMIVPAPRSVPFEQRLKRIEEHEQWWRNHTTEEDREAFARDLEAAHALYNQPVKFASWE